MIKNIFLFLVISLIILGCDNSSNKTKIATSEKQKKSIEKSFYDNGKLKQQISYCNGKIEGEWIEYYKNGNIKSISFWKNNKKDGISKEYYKNKQLALVSFWEKGLGSGVWKYYYDDGKIWFIATYDENHGRIKGILYDKQGNKREVKKSYLFNELDKIFDSYNKPNKAK